MKIEDTEIKFLVRMAKKILNTTEGEILKSKIRYKQKRFDELMAVAINLYQLSAKEEGKKDEDLLLNPGDQSQLVYLIIALAMNSETSLKSCMKDLAQCLIGFNNIVEYSKNRMAKCLQEAAKQIKLTSG